MKSISEPDYLVVGSGLSGLVFAALASERGARVTVLEAHEHAGGFGHTFSMGKSAKFNAQLHYVWNCGEGETVNLVLRELGLDKTVTFERMDPDGFDRMVIPGYDLKIPADSTELCRRLTAIAPSAGDAIRGFLKRVDTVARGLDLVASEKTVQRLVTDGPAALTVARHLKQSLQDVFDLFKLPLHVQSVLASQWPDFLLPPRELSFFAWVMLFTGYQRGAYYATHHFEHVIDSLVESIERRGGTVRLNQEVTAFSHDGERVSGVSVRDRQTDEHYEVTAQNIVCNMDPKRAASMIGETYFSDEILRKLRYEYSPSNFMIYCTVRGVDLREHGFGRWNTFHCDDDDINQAFDRMYVHHDYSRPSFAITTPGLMTPDTSDRGEGEEIMEFLTVADYAWFDELRRRGRREYVAMKREIVERIFDVMEERYIPDFRQYVNFRISGTPTTNERFCWAPEGNSYGSNMTPGNIGLGRLSSDTSLKHFYFCNASAGFPGFAGSFFNGRSLCNRLIPAERASS